MRTVQEIFKVAIEEGFYGEGPYADVLMCNALEHACKQGLITFIEKFSAKREIFKYMETFWKGRDGKDITLKSCLDKEAFSSDFEARLEIYKNWENRPLPNYIKTNFKPS